MKMYVWYAVDDPNRYYQGTIITVADNLEEAKAKIRRLGMLGENASKHDPDEVIDVNSKDCAVYVDGGE